MEYKIRIKGKEYPARFTIRVAILTAERRGKSLKNIFANENQAEFLEDIPWLAVEMIKAGAALREKETGMITPEIPTVENILDSVDYADIRELQAQILQVITKDEPTVKAEGSGKNTDATPET